MLNDKVLQLVGTETRDWPQIMSMIEEILAAATELGKQVWATNAGNPGPEDGSIPLTWEKAPLIQVLDFITGKIDTKLPSSGTNVAKENNAIKQLMEELLPGMLESALESSKLQREKLEDNLNHLKESVADLVKTKTV